MLLSALPLAVSFYCLYQPPDALSDTGLFLWFLTFMVLMRTAKTFASVPHAALGAELTEDYHERTSVFGYNSVVGMLGGIGLGVFVLVVVFPSTPEYANGLLDESRYAFLAGLGAVVIVIALLVCTLGTRDQIPFLHQQEARAIKVRAYLKEVWQLLRNRSYIAVCASWLVLATSIGILTVVSTYTYVYAFELSTEQLTIQRFVTIPGILIVLPLSIFLTRWMDKKRTLIFGYMVSAFFLGLPFCLRMVGWFPENDSPWLLLALFGPLFLSYLVGPLLPVVIDSQLADIADDHEYRTGHRSEGVVFSIRTFAIKATSGIGGLVGGFGLDIIGFPENAVVGEIASTTLDGLLFMSGPLYWMIALAGVGFMAMYQLNEKRHAELLEALKLRRSGSIDLESQQRA